VAQHCSLQWRVVRHAGGQLNIILAAIPEIETPFTLLLRADSEHACPDTDADVVMALDPYEAVFKTTKQRRRLAWSSSPA
jgi:hypothetical protein